MDGRTDGRTDGLQRQQRSKTNRGEEEGKKENGEVERERERGVIPAAAAMTDSNG